MWIAGGRAWDVALSILLLTRESRAFLDCGDVHLLFIFLLQGLIQQTLKMYQLVLPLPTSPPSLSPAVCFELFAQDFFIPSDFTSLPCTAKNLLFCSLWYLAGKQKEHKEEKDNNCFFPDDLTHKSSF